MAFSNVRLLYTLNRKMLCSTRASSITLHKIYRGRVISNSRLPNCVANFCISVGASSVPIQNKKFYWVYKIADEEKYNFSFLSTLINLKVLL
jgi:hypothetical protein